MMMMTMTMMVILMMQQEAEDDTDSSSVVTKKPKANHLLFQTLESKSCAGSVPTLQLDILAINSLDHDDIRNIAKIR